MATSERVTAGAATSLAGLIAGAVFAAAAAGGGGSPAGAAPPADPDRGWSPPADVSSPFGPAFGLPAVAQGAGGAALVAWSEPAPRARHRVMVAERAPAGEWSDPAVVAVLPWQVTQVALALGPGGGADLAWSMGYAARAVVQAVHRPPAGAWTRPQAISRVGTNLGELGLVVDRAGAATAAWSLQAEAGGPALGRVQIASRRPGGRWSDPTTLSRPSGPSSSPRLAVDAGGRVTVAFLAAEGRPAGSGAREVVLTREGPDGTWTRPQPLAPGPGRRAVRLDLAVGDSGRAAVVWEHPLGRGGAGGSEVWAATGAAPGRWSAPVRLSAPRAAAEAPTVAIDRRGEVVAAWGEAHGPAVSTLRARSRAPGGRWSPGTTVARTPVPAPLREAGPARVAWSARLAADGPRPVLVWSQLAPPGPALLRFSVSASARRPGGGWDPPLRLSAPGDALSGAALASVGDRAVTSWLGADATGRASRVRVATRG